METIIDFANNVDTLVLSVGGIGLVFIVAFIIAVVYGRKHKSANKESNTRIEDLEMIISALQLELDEHTYSKPTLARDERKAKAKKPVAKMKKQKEATVVEGSKKRGRKPKKA